MISKPESGNVLFIILIAVALFGALNFVVGNMLRGGNPQAISEQKASILADEILAQARDIRQTVQNLRISNGCGDDDISFENPITAGYEHSPVADDECKVFHPDGGGLNYIAPPEEWLETSQSGNTGYAEVRFVGKPAVLDIGSGEKELIMFVNFVKQPICLAINDKSGIINTSGAPPVDVGAVDTTTLFQGSYLSGSGLNASEISGKLYGCVSSGTNNFFYQVLIVR